MNFEASRAKAIEKLDNFIEKNLSDYSRLRNFDFGPDKRDNVSCLSPFVTHGVLNEIEIIKWGTFTDFDMIVNATSLGLKGGQSFDFRFENTKVNLIYIDTIYNPLETEVIKYLKGKDVKVFNGLDMFIYQGQKSFYLWNKVNPEIDDELLELLNSKLK